MKVLRFQKYLGYRKSREFQKIERGRERQRGREGRERVRGNVVRNPWEELHRAKVQRDFLNIP